MNKITNATIVNFLNTDHKLPATLDGVKLTFTAFNSIVESRINKREIGERTTASGDHYWVAMF